jgi:hypothetical protein
MSRWLGLREDQQQGEVLAMLISGLFPSERGDAIAGTPRSYRLDLETISSRTERRISISALCHLNPNQAGYMAVIADVSVSKYRPD